jgi:hypothetical protein
MVIMTDRFDEKFLEMEQEFSQKAFRLHDLERQARAEIRSDVDASDEERQERYIARWKQLNEEFERAANEHGRQVYEMPSVFRADRLVGG